MCDTMEITENKTEWAKFGNISNISFMGKEILCFGKGCHLVFINLNTLEETIFRANNKEFGDGIQCFATHRSANVFAFAENGINPTIYVYNYPKMELVTTLTEMNKDGFINLAFSEVSIIISLGGLPNFTITAWNWRKGEKIATKNGSIMQKEQHLRCNLASPVYVAQLGLNTNKLYLWDMHICGKKCVLTEHLIKLSHHKCASFNEILWTTEGGLFVLDKTGCVFMLNSDYKLDKIIAFNGNGNNLTSFVWHKAGLTITGPDNKIRHYKKSGSWYCDWDLTPPEPIKNLKASRSDLLIGTTTSNNIIRIIQSEKSFKYIRQYEGTFNDFCLIYPNGEYLVTLNHSRSLNIIKISSGENMQMKLKSLFKLNPKLIFKHLGLATCHLKHTQTILSLASNPEFSYIAIGLNNGVMDLISVHQPTKLTKMTSLFLTKNPITKVYFSEGGRVIVAANLTYGEFFIVEGLPGDKMEIVSTIETHLQIVNFMLVPSRTCYRLYAIPVTSDEVLAGNKIIRYCVVKNNYVHVKEYEFTDSKLYNKLVATAKPNRDRIFYGIPYCGKIINEIETKRGENKANIISKIATGHQLRKIDLYLDKYHAVTWSYDGFVIARDLEFKTDSGIALAHHRLNGGVQKAIIDPCGQFIVSLGRDNLLVCTSLKNILPNSELKNQLATLVTSPRYCLLFINKTTGPAEKGQYKNVPWIEIDKLNKTEIERLKCLKERKLILEELNSIKKALGKLLTQNMAGPDNEKLNLLEFNLDTKLYEEKVEENREICKATDIYLRNLIEAQDKVSKWIMATFWDIMHEKMTRIDGIFENFSVENFVLPPPKVEVEEEVRLVESLRQIEDSLTVPPNVFEPWFPPCDKPIEEDVPQKRISKLLESGKSYDLIATISQEVSEKDIETKIAFEGTDTGLFLDVSIFNYMQMQLNSNFQIFYQRVICNEEIRKLKKKFNKDFSLMMNQKTKDMNTILERNNRVRHIISEINYFSTEKFNMDIVDPEWKQPEHPELIIKVSDNEVWVTPYISPSEQLILDVKAAEEERIRLLLLADDFKERALMKMMNGVLEIRWEDELKKDVPLPKCMLEKEPENYNEEDLKAVKEYEEKVKFLISERERYKKMLWSELGKISIFLKDLIKKFNKRLTDVMLLKMKVQSAVYQEALKVSRFKLNSHKKQQFYINEQNIMEKIRSNEEVMQSLKDLLFSLQDSLNECRSVVDSLQTRERFLEKGFRRDFQDIPYNIQEQVYKLYRKRPKVNLRGLNSVTILLELAKCVMSKEYTRNLTPECVEFLKAVDEMDIQPVHAPQTVLTTQHVDEFIFQTLYKHRRLRIEFEIKVKVANLQLVYAEQTATIFQKRLQAKKEKNIRYFSELAQVRTGVINFMHNLELQIALPKGYVEIPLKGELQDFDDAIMICRKDVEDINKIILTTGDDKLKTMIRAMKFRRGILFNEWEHKRLTMQIKDLEEKLVDINDLRLTRDMKTYLKNPTIATKGSVEMEVEMMKTSYETSIRKKKEEIKKLKKQIQTIKENNKIIDQKIIDINVDVCEYQLMKDVKLESKEKNVMKLRMMSLLKRSKYVQQIQENYNDILVQQTELEILRLKTYPTLKFKVLE